MMIEIAATINLIFMTLVWFGSGIEAKVSCPPRCKCTLVKEGSDSYVVDCAKLGLKTLINPNDLPENVNKLDLSENHIERIGNYSFRTTNLTKIKKLDLSKNDLLKIETNAFAGLNKLTQIDLSSNKLSVLPERLFSSLNRLKKINLEENRLICDCNLGWMVKWRKRSKRSSVRGRCLYPFALRDKKIEQVDRNDMICENLELPVMSLGPLGDTIAFKGDSYRFECKFSWIPDMQMIWYKDSQQLPLNTSNNHRSILFKLDSIQIVWGSTLEIKELSVEDIGLYGCVVTYPGGYKFTRTSHLSVIPSDSPFCNAATTATSKGTFHWHDTAAGGTAFLPCPLGVMGSFPDRRGAQRNCSVNGDWMEVEAEPCVHANEITRALHDLKEKVVNDTTVASVSEQLLNISKQAAKFSHLLDVVYTANVVQNLAQTIGGNMTFIYNLLNTISNIMETDAEILLAAEKRSKSCSSLVLQLNALHSRFPQDVQTMSFVSNNIVIYLAPITSTDHNLDKTCFVNSSLQSLYQDIKCQSCSSVEACEMQMAHLSSIYLPSSLFPLNSTDENIKFQFSVFSNSKLFQEVKEGSKSKQLAKITSSVLSLQFGDAMLPKPTQPVVIKFENHQKGEQPLPVYWDFSSNGGFGRWKTNTDCSKVLFEGNRIVTQCYQLSNSNVFAIMMNVTKPRSNGARYQEAVRDVMQFIVFVAAGIASLLILITMIAYAVIRELRFDRDDTAMLMNLCLSLLVTIVVFVTGVRYVSNKLVCRSVGVLLHYFVLCSLLWIGCSGICLNRLIRTAIKPEEYNPVLRYYMTSWGIPLIICGITIAGNVENYNVEDYCWLRTNPFYGAFLGPACLILFIDFIIFLRLFNAIKGSYDGDACLQLRPEADVIENVAEENALVIQQETSPSEEDNVHCADKPALPDRVEMEDLLRGNCVSLLAIIVNVALGVFLIRYWHNFVLYITLQCLFAVGLIALGAVVFVFYCVKKKRIRSRWQKLSCKWRCFPGKSYEIHEEILQPEATDSPPATVPIVNVEVVEQFTSEEIHGAKNVLCLEDGDSISNVSLPSSAAITLNKQVVDLPEKEVEVQVEKASSVSDKHSWASAPLPLQYKPRDKLGKKSPGYRHSFSENLPSTPTIEECRKAPLAPPEATASSVESSVHIPTDTASNIAPSEGPLTLRDAADTGNVSRNTNTSCSASEVSIPFELPVTKSRPPALGSSSHGSDGLPSLQLRKTRPNETVMQNGPAVPRPPGIVQELIDHYSIPVGGNNSIPRQIPRDHVVVRERYHIPYEPRAVSEKPRDHYQIVPLSKSCREPYVLQPGHDQYEDPRDQSLGSRQDNPYPIAEHFPIRDEQNPRQPIYVNQAPTPTHPRPFEYCHFKTDTMPSPRAYDLHHSTRDQVSPRLHECQVPHEQGIRHGPGGSPSPRLREDPQFSPENIRPRSPNPNESNLTPRSPDHHRVSLDSSTGHRSHDQNQDAPRDNVGRASCPNERPHENISAPSDQSSVPRAHELNENDFSRDLSQTPRDQNRAGKTARGPFQKVLEKPLDQYAGEGPRDQPQALNPGEKSTSVNQRPGVPPDQNASKCQNAPTAGTREQPKGIHVSRRRSRRNPYQIARDIHHNLGIETRPSDRQQSRRQRRVPPADQCSQPQKASAKLPVSSNGDTPKERTPRSSMSSWKEDRPKGAKKGRATDLPKSAVLVPVSHLPRSSPEPPRNETSV